MSVVNRSRESAVGSVVSLHAPEVECISKGKAHRPYEFGVKVSVATTISRAQGGQFVTHVKALPGNPYDGHTLATVIPDMEALVGNTIARILADKVIPRPQRAARSQAQGLHLRPEARANAQDRARTAPQGVEPVIGHLEAEQRMGRNYLWFRHGDAANAVPAAAGYNFRRLIRWLSSCCCAKSSLPSLPRFRPFRPETRVLHGRLATAVAARRLAPSATALMGQRS
ncbi:IS5 family transposase [Bradyrhizobium sp. S3.2.6]